ncbi:sugar-phosphatase [Photorhabdus heterorhabditis]|uniref:Sugar phosphatase n=1 Tax=Photorhabdus heterorhabditis TaxID=880156 RepID=A0A5B0WP88_9GAMM|nr:sugar-phosphatase [Photorhabdus heterorhabditis]KAA1188586.1 sugar-phosphatase [Photorhabdus heterorhabditis]KOY62298.1 sugar phosphatase [Photorhabdus heterorhabditis]
MSIKLIAIDLDGTLLNESHQITPPVKQAIHYARKQGIHIVLASGRPFTGIQRYLQELALNETSSYCISNNGSVVHQANDGEHLLENLLDFEDYLFFESLSREIGVHLHALEFNKIYTANRDISPYTVREAFLTDTPLIYCPINEMDNEMRFTKLMMIDHPNILSDAINFIPVDAYEHYTLMQSSPYFLEILSKEVNKGTAIKAIADHLGITRDKIMCIGDHNNDLAMIEFAGIGVAMGNAEQSVKDIAQFITATNEQDGVAIAINKFL